MRARKKQLRRAALFRGRYWDRTSDLFRVREARYRCANRPEPVKPAVSWVRSLGIKRADDEIRTRDIHLGKVVLYQLSYVRIFEDRPEANIQLQASFLALVGDTGIEPVTSSVSGKRATAAPIAHCIRRNRKPWLSPRWVRDSNPCIRLCRPLPRLSANPPCRR